MSDTLLLMSLPHFLHCIISFDMKRQHCIIRSRIRIDEMAFIKSCSMSNQVSKLFMQIDIMVMIEHIRCG